MTQTMQTDIIMSKTNSVITESLDTWVTSWPGFADFCVQVMSWDFQ